MARFDYQSMIQEALRHVLHLALSEVAEGGLTDGHHFYITFDTGAPGVEIARVLRDLYPQEMTIVLQHQYWDLVVEEHSFAVTLAFNGSRHRLAVPFRAVTAFVDPEAQFGLRFEITDVPPADLPVPEAEPEVRGPRAVKPLDPPGGQVVSIEEFRKK